MKKKLLYFFCFLLPLLLSYCAGGQVTDANRTTETNNVQVTLAGTNDGLFSVNSSGKLSELWTEGSVKKILSLPNGTWVTMGSEGIQISSDLKTWEARNQGLPLKTIKVFQNRQKSFLQIVQEIKDLEVNPENPQVMVCATKDRVYLSRNQGESWTSLGAPANRANGIKAVAAANMPQESSAASSGAANSEKVLTVFMSHSIYGIYYIQPDKPNAAWIELSGGLVKLETTNNADEVADIAVVMINQEPVIYVSQTFRRLIYKLDWQKKEFNLVLDATGKITNPILEKENPFGTVDSLFPVKNELFFLYEGAVASIDLNDHKQKEQQAIFNTIRAVSSSNKLNCVVVENKNNNENIILSELWLLNEANPQAIADKSSSPQSTHIAANKEGIYIPVNHAMESRTLQPYLDTIHRAGLNMIVIDVKDDYGRLRFTPNNTAISDKGRVFRPLDLDAFLRSMKEKGIFTVARVVVFKDPELAKKENGRFAVWDGRNNKPWQGYRDQRRRVSAITEEDRTNSLMQFFPTDDPEFEIVRTMYDENWVDPYSEEVWEYIVILSQELYQRGFDEIQFDYIRFPTDGDNLHDARYRWQDRGMDMESAILSFLRHARPRITAPISIDIYGANGWYRTGARTGQEVELLAPWVDVICPMYYPSHFEQHFLAQNPPEMRPWRIYYTGTLRNDRIARGQVVIRPWTQAFFLNVSYDRQYYNEDYVRRQVEAVRMAGNGGYTHWNNIGRYADIPDK